MKRPLHLVILIFTLTFLFSPRQVFGQGANRVDIGKSFANMSKLATGGTYNPGDTIEIRVTIAVLKQLTYTAIDSVQVFDSVPSNTTYIPGSIRIATNQGLTYKGPFTDAADADQASNVGGSITINLGNGANSTKGGRIRSDTSKPSFFGSACIMMACYRVRINPAAAYGDTLFVGGSVNYTLATPTKGFVQVKFPSYKILLFNYTGYCSNGSDVSAASDSLGTFASGAVQNRAAALAFSTTYIKQNVSSGQPQDYNYAIVNNSSPDATTNVNSPMPEGTALHRVFGFWDICGDHTGAAIPSLGNPPAVSGTRGGYFVMVNASYNTNVAYQENLSNLCPNTYYEFSAWFRNICPRCSCDSNGKGSSSAGFIPYPGNDSAGVRPNLSFEIDDLAYYTSGDIKYDRAIPWKQYGFTFLTKPTQTTANFVIRNNSPGGGGNDWAIDDIKVAHCGPSLNMNYAPWVQGCKEGPFLVELTDTVRYIYNSYVYFKWQKSNVGGTVWSDMTGPGTSGVGTPTLVNGLYQYVTALPGFIANYADSGTYYRVTVATTAANLASTACSYDDGGSTMVKVITCHIILAGNFLQFRASLVNEKGLLNWSTSGEHNLRCYDIEKSTDAVNFEKLGTTQARNTSDAAYNFQDPELFTGNRYYRLKMIDENNLYKYSNTVLLSKNLLFDVKFQNPFTETLTGDVIIPTDAPITFTIYSEKGQPVRIYTRDLKKGLNKVYLDGFSGLSAGVYVVSTEMNHESIKQKIIKR